MGGGGSGGSSSARNSMHTRRVNVELCARTVTTCPPTLRLRDVIVLFLSIIIVVIIFIFIFSVGFRTRRRDAFQIVSVHAVRRFRCTPFTGSFARNTRSILDKLHLPVVLDFRQMSTLTFDTAIAIFNFVDAYQLYTHT